MDHQAQYWVWMKRRQILNSIKDTWEEKAFMEDVSGQLGGCIWPPRSYSCTFCRREFRSAQALGGHMNVHRRDRARLKQSLSPCNKDLFQPQNPNQTTSPQPMPMDSHFSPESCALGYDLDLTSPGSLSSPRVSALSTQESLNHDHHIAVASPFSSFSGVKEQTKGCPNSICKLSVSSSSPTKEKIRGEDLTILTKNISNIGADLFMGSNSTKSTTISRGDHEAISTCKRLKTAVSTLFWMDPCFGVVGDNPNSFEDIDLELRLGW